MHPFTTLLITAFISTVSWAKTIDITNITEPIVAQDGDILTGTRSLKAKISIADGATVTLQNFTHYDAYTSDIKPEPGITCEGNATIILKNENVIEGTNEYPGIYVPENKTLTIQGTGSLAASSLIAPAIGGDTTSVSGDIIIKGGSISAKGGIFSAAIGSYKNKPCGDITISGSRIIATKGREATYTIGGETSGKITIGGIETGVIKTRQYVYPLRTVHGTFNLSNTTNYAGYQLTDGVTLTGKLETNTYISIADGATVTIKDVSINNEKNSLFRWPGITCEGDATILIDGKDTIQGGDYHAGIFIPENKTLTIKGNGNLTVYSGSYAAGIGGEDYIPGGNVTILEGTIKAQAGLTGGVGIGSGSHAEFGKITIKGGIILAKGNSAAIGAAYGGSYEDISITGGEVYALGGGFEPSIGTLSKGGNISIGKNATVFALMDEANPYINIKAGSNGSFTVDGVEKGTIKEYFFVYPIHTINDTLDLSKVTKAAGYQLADGAVLTGKLNTNAYITIADGANVTLKNATINRQANEFYNWAGITCEGDATINLNGQNSVRPFFGNAGIFVPENKTLNINGQGKLNANGYSGAAIGGTSYRKSGNIVINGGTINATGSGGSGIGCGGYGGKVFCGDITINGGTITATSNDAAGIGCSSRATCGNITINGGTIVATGGLNYAGIGCGGALVTNICGDISINGGSVTASKGKGANSSIGRGNTKSTVGKITIGGVETEDIETSPYTVSYYAITFDANGGTGKTMKNVLFIDSEIQNLTTNTFVRNGYIFNDWNTEADGSGEIYKDGQIVSSSGKEPGTVYLYAQWIKLLSAKDISIAEIEPQIYTGFNICPEVTIKDGDKTLIKGTDYTVDCSNNINTGKASINITGIGNYEGKITQPFEIVLSKAQYAAITILEDHAGKRAIINGDYMGVDPVSLDKEIYVSSVEFNRTFEISAYSTIMLPFDIKTSKISGIEKVFQFTGVLEKDNGEKEVQMDEVWVSTSNNDFELIANTPYIIKMKDSKLKINGGVTLKPATSESAIVRDESGWEFRGTFAYKEWLEDSDELGLVYGYTGEKLNGYEIGQFARVGAGASIHPFRAYMFYKDPTSTSFIKSAYSITNELPDHIDIVIANKSEDNSSEKTTTIGKFNTRTGEIHMNRDNRTYDLKGRNITGKSKAKGVYFNKTRLLH